MLRARAFALKAGTAATQALGAVRRRTVVRAFPKGRPSGRLCLFTRETSLTTKSRPRIALRKSSRPPLVRPRTRSPVIEEHLHDGESAAAACPRGSDPGPILEIGQAPVGRETLAAIAIELLEPDPAFLLVEQCAPESGETVLPTPKPPADPKEGATEKTNPAAPSRFRRRTLGFSDHPPELGGTSAPEGSFMPVAQEETGSRQALHAELDHWARTGEASPGSRRDLDSWEVFEMATFVVRGDVTRLSSMTARREFVGERLLHRLPVDSLEQVDRIDITPWTVHGTVIVRVWCRV